jgi:hypothetical protein
MTPADSLIALQILVNDFQIANEATNIQYDKETVLEWIKISNTTTNPLVTSVVSQFNIRS